MTLGKKVCTVSAVSFTCFFKHIRCTVLDLVMKPSTDPCSEFVPHVCQKGKCNQCFCKEEDHAQGSNINSDNAITLRPSSPAVPSRSSIPVRPNPIHQPRTSTMANGKL